MAHSGGRRSIFITGAASGIGRETARLFGRQGWFVGAYDVDAVGLQSLEEELGPENGVFAILDVTQPKAFEASMQRFDAATGGRLDLLFNNAGVTGGGMFDEVAWDQVMQVVNVNLLGVMTGIRAGLPLLRATPGSLCLNTSSSSAIWGSAGIGVYSATKHAVRGLTEALSVEFKRYGVRVADLLPGLVDTPILPATMRAMAPPGGMWRLIPPAEVARTVLTAYEADRLHWYVPEELRAFHAQVVAEPEVVREERTALAAQMAAAGAIAPPAGDR